MVPFLEEWETCATSEKHEQKSDFFLRRELGSSFWETRRKLLLPICKWNEFHSFHWEKKNLFEDEEILPSIFWMFQNDNTFLLLAEMKKIIPSLCAVKILATLQTFLFYISQWDLCSWPVYQQNHVPSL